MAEKRRQILCIEDDERTRELIEAMLSLSDDYDLTFANDGAEANERIADRTFDLYIIDFRLPDANGLELCRRIRLSEPRKPIVFFSGEARPVDRDMAIVAGADAFLTKAHDVGKLPEVVQQLLSEGRPLE